MQVVPAGFGLAFAAIGIGKACLGTFNRLCPVLRIENADLCRELLPLTCMRHDEMPQVNDSLSHQGQFCDIDLFRQRHSRLAAQLAGDGPGMLLNEAREIGGRAKSKVACDLLGGLVCFA